MQVVGKGRGEFVRAEISETASHSWRRAQRRQFAPANHPIGQSANRRAMSRFEDPVVITNSISGAVANRDQCPAIPYTPEEYAAEAKRAVDEGASMNHIHARTPDGVPSYEVEDFQAITEAILGAVDDVIINYSTGAIGVPLEKRIEYRPARNPTIGGRNMGRLTNGKTPPGGRDSALKP